MTEDYFKVLGVTPRANDKELKHAYKDLAMKWHPDKNPGNREEASRQFEKINEAFQVLSNPDKRAKYMAAYSALHRRQKSVPGSFQVGPSDFDNLYERFFGKQNPQGKPNMHPEMRYPSESFAPSNFTMHSMESSAHPDSPPSDESGGNTSPRQNHESFSHLLPCSSENIDINVLVTLGEIYTGTTKNVEVIRVVDGRPKKKTFKVNLNPGIKPFVQLTLKNKGHKKIGEAASDIHFNIQQQQHPVYMRRKDDIIDEVDVSAYDAAIGMDFSEMGIDGEMISFQLAGPIKQDSVVRVKERGMIKEGGKGRGDAVFLFTIIWPDDIDPETRQKIESTLQE